MIVSRATPLNVTRRCPCGQEDCRPGQRNGPACASKASKEFRRREKARKSAMVGLALAGIAARARGEG